MVAVDAFEQEVDCSARDQLPTANLCVIQAEQPWVQLKKCLNLGLAGRGQESVEILRSATRVLEPVMTALAQYLSGRVPAVHILCQCSQKLKPSFWVRLSCGEFADGLRHSGIEHLEYFECLDGALYVCRSLYAGRSPSLICDSAEQVDPLSISGSPPTKHIRIKTTTEPQGQLF